MYRILLIVCLGLLQARNIAVAVDNPSALDNGKLMQWINIGEKLMQGEGFEDYASAMDTLDIAVSTPQGMHLATKGDRSNTLVFSPNPVYKSNYYEGVVGGSLIGPIFESNKKDAQIAYPLGVEIIGVSPDRLVETELIAANANDSIDISPIISSAQNADYSNADRIMVYEFNVNDPNWKGPRHCVALTFRKKGHYAFPVKVFLNDEALKLKDKYIELVLKSVKYGNEPMSECIELESLVRPDEGSFPMEKPFKCKHGE